MSGTLRIGSFEIKAENPEVFPRFFTPGDWDGMGEQKVILTGPNNVSFAGPARVAAEIVSRLSRPSVPHFSFEGGRLFICLPNGRRFDVTRHNTPWLLTLVMKDLGCSDEQLRQVKDEFIKAIKDRPWQKRYKEYQDNENGNAKKAAEPATTA
jgi:hypothetical protein